MIRHHTGNDGKKQNVRVLSFTPSTSHRSARAFSPFSRNQKQGLFERETQALIQSQVKTGNQVFTSAGDINNHFTNVGQSLAQEIPSSEIDPLAYVNPVDGVFSFQRINVQKVIKLLKAIDVSKATGLDKIPNRLLKIAADVVAPSLTGIFNQSLVTGIFPSD